MRKALAIAVFRLCGGVLIAVNCAGAHAYAQSAEAFLTDSSSLGHDASSWTVRLAAPFTYDSNVARSDATEAASRGLKLSDEYASPSLYGDLVRSNGEMSVSLHAVAAYDAYVRNTVLNGERFNLDAAARHRFAGRCAAGLKGAVFHRRTNLADIFLPDSGGVVNTENVTVDVACPRPIGFSPVISGGAGWGSYTRPELSLSDYHTLSATGGMAYYQPTIGSLTLLGDFQHTEYPHRPISVGGTSRFEGYNTYGAALTYQRHIGARLDGSAWVGYTKLDPTIVGDSSFSGITYGGSLRYLVTPRLSAHVDFERRTIPSIQYESTYTLQESVSGNLDYQATSRMSFGAGISHLSRDYAGSLLSNALLVAHDDGLAFFGSARVKLGRRFEIALQGRHETRNASVTAYNYVSNQAMLTLSVAY